MLQLRTAATEIPEAVALPLRDNAAGNAGLDHHVLDACLLAAARVVEHYQVSR